MEPRRAGTREETTAARAVQARQASGPAPSKDRAPAAPDTDAPAPDTNTPAPDTNAPAADNNAPALDTDAPAPDTDATQASDAEPALSALTDLVIITGFSGAGKSTAMAAFEDEGYFCVDNLPSEMIRSLVELFRHAGSKVARAAVVSDVRGGSYFGGLAQMLDDLRASGVAHRVLFLEADEQALLTRYKETRRRHPLAPSGSVVDGIAQERELLRSLRGRADIVIDTTGLTAAMLRRKLADDMLLGRRGRLAVTFESFGFKYGPVRDADLMFDVRFLPNPHYEEDLRPLTGNDPRVKQFINRDGALDSFYERLHPMLDYLLPQYLAEGKAHLVVAIGCTGGRHRSIAIARDLASRYGSEEEYLVETIHRDADRPI